MAQHLKAVEKDTADALKQAESQLSALTKSKEWEATKTAADVAGLVDPTPTSDLVSMGMSAAEGDWVGALLSGVSFAPYLGDAMAKPIKFARAAKRAQQIEKEVAAMAKAVDMYKSQAMKFAQRTMAAAATRAKRAKDAAAQCAKQGKVVGCNPFGTQLPSTKGEWQGTRGNSKWTSENGKVSVEYEHGYPNFKKSKPPALHKDGGGEVEIFQTGQRGDFTAARDAMRKKLGNNNWPGNGDYAPDGYTWHHKEDGVTMQLVESKAHNVTQGGGSHTGGSSIVKSDEF